MIFLRINLPNFVQFKQYQVCSKQDFSVFTTVNINISNTDTVTK